MSQVLAHGKSALTFWAAASKSVMIAPRLKGSSRMEKASTLSGVRIAALVSFQLSHRWSQSMQSERRFRVES